MRASSEAEKEALEQSRRHETWYGWQTVTVDAAAVGVLLLGATIATSAPPRLDGPPNPRPLAFGAASLGVYALGPPVVHVAHGEVWKGLASIGLRVLMPLAGGALGYLVAGALPSREPGAVEAGAIGGLIGGVAAMATDATALGWQRWYNASAPHTSAFRVAFAF